MLGNLINELQGLRVHYLRHSTMCECVTVKLSRVHTHERDRSDSLEGLSNTEAPRYSV